MFSFSIERATSVLDHNTRTTPLTSTHDLRDLYKQVGSQRVSTSLEGAGRDGLIIDEFIHP